MRARIMLVLVCLVAGALFAAGFGALVIARHSARQDATTQLVQQASSLAIRAGDVKTVPSLRIIDQVLQLQDGAVVRITTDGAVVTPGAAANQLPNGITLSTAQGQRLVAGQSVSGWEAGAAFAAVPISQGLLRGRAAGYYFAVLLTRQTGNIGPSWGYFVLVSGLVLVVAALIALWLSRRITRPLVEVTAVTERVARGDLGARLATSTGEIPELVTLAQSINSMAERLQGTRERERQMLLSVSHDLRTPLTSIRGYAEAIEDGVAENPAKAAGVIVSESRRLERLVADLLDLARLEMSGLSLHRNPTDVGEVVQTTVEGFLPQADRRNLRLRTQLPPAGPALIVPADRDRLAQVVANLVENALAYATSAVTVTLWRESAGATITVEDDGAGIAPGDLPKVFDRFYQADHGSSRGSGLGLAIVSELLQAMGGRIEAISPSNPTGGTRMVVRLSA
jgi:signal transduction histidine kinase